MTRIDIEEVHHRILNIAEAFDKICAEHDIPYYMLGGTMLGAIRHKGFIPWDDDMDFGVPYEHYNRLISILEKELPRGMRCCTFENSKAVVYPFMKIEDTETCIEQERKYAAHAGKNAVDYKGMQDVVHPQPAESKVGHFRKLFYTHFKKGLKSRPDYIKGQKENRRHYQNE